MGRAREPGAALALFVATLCVAPLAAQGRGAPPPDTTSVKKVDSGFVLSYTNQDLGTVLSARRGGGWDRSEFAAASGGEKVTLNATAPRRAR